MIKVSNLHKSFGKVKAVRDIAFELHDRHSASRSAVGELRTALAEVDRLQRSYIVTRDTTTRAELFVALLDALLVSSRTDHDGGFFKAVDARMTPGPVQQPRPPFPLPGPRPTRFFLRTLPLAGFRL